MMPGSERLWYWLVDYYALATCVLLTVWLIVMVLRQPARRLAVTWSAAVGLLALPALAMIPAGPRTSLVTASARVEPIRPSPPGLPVMHSVAGEASAFPGRAEPRAEKPAAPPREHTNASVARVALPAAGPGRLPARSPIVASPNGRSLVGGAFLAGAGLMVVWLALGSWQTAMLRRRSKPAPARVADVLARVIGPEHAAPALLLSKALRHPVAVGLVRPAILLPERFVATEPRYGLEAALAHEWAHLRNRDLWLVALLRLLLPVLFAHPGYWWLRRRIRDDQEMLADAAAAGVEGRVDYAEVLLAWSRESMTRTCPVFAAAGSVALFERPSQITLRIVTLLDQSFRIEGTCPGGWKLIVRGCTALAVVALSLFTLRPSAVGADPPQDKPAASTSAGSLARVVDPGGKPVAGVKVYLSKGRDGLNSKTTPATLLATTGADGSFPPPQVAAEERRQIHVVAMADGYGPGLGDSSAKEGLKDLTLVPDDVPIRGRVLDIQGQPVAGASVQVVGLLWHPSGRLDEWIEKLKTEKAAFSVQYSTLQWWAGNDVPSLFPPVTADSQGRFTLKGIGRERVASLLISGPRIETRFEYVATRAMPVIKVPDWPRQNYSREVTYYGADVDLVSGPCLEAIGTVTDQDTGKPLSGVLVQTTALFGNPLRTLSTTTDDQGHYRLTGIPPRTHFNDEQDLLVSSEDGPPYLPATKHLGKGDGVNPLTVDFPLKRGVWAKGRVVEKATGQGVRANLSYYIMADNPYLKTYPKYGTLRVGSPFKTDEDGTFRLIVMPGPGVIGARVGNEHYRLGVGVDTIEGAKRENGGLEMISAQPSYLIPTNYHTVIGIRPKEGDDTVTCEIALDRGKTVNGKIVGPDGAPVAGARIEGLQDHFRSWSHQPLPSDEFLVEGISPGAARDLLVYHEGKKLAGAYVIGADERGPITVKLEPCGTVTGRLVDAGGLPLRQVDVTCNVPFNDLKHESGSLPAPIKTGDDGRFRAEALVAGRKYTFRVWKGKGMREAIKDIVVATGETRDLGDVTINANE